MNSTQAAVDFYRDVRAILKREKERRAKRSHQKPPPTPPVKPCRRTPEVLKAYRLFMLDRISKNAEHRRLIREAAKEFDELEATQKASKRRRVDKPKRGTMPPIACGWRAGDDGIIPRRKTA